MNDLDNFDSESSDDYVLDANETVPPFMFQENVLSRVESQLDLDEKVIYIYIDLFCIYIMITFSFNNLL